MSSTLTWNVYGPATKTGTAIGNCWTDLKNMIDAKAADANFKWQVASSNVGSSPYYVVLKRKNGAAGRILFVEFSPTVASNAAIFGQNPVLSTIYAAWFPNGNADTPSNLTSASGTILGDDSGCVKVAPMSSGYGASMYWNYADCEDGVVIFTGTTSATQYLAGAGALLVDGTDTAYGATFGSANWQYSTLMQSTSNSMWMFAAGGTTPGNNSTAIRTNDGGTDKYLGTAWVAAWPNATSGSANDVLSNTTLNKAWFVPIALLGTTKGEGFKFKLRQMALGPTVPAGPFPTYTTTGPVVAATAPHTGTGATSFNTLWLTNFKV